MPYSPISVRQVNIPEFVDLISETIYQGNNILITTSGTGADLKVVISATGDAVGMSNPMTGIGDLIVGGAAGYPTALSPGTSGYALVSNGPGAAPSWTAQSSSSSVDFLLVQVFS